MARGTTGAPRNTPGSGPGVPATGGDTGTERQQTRGQETRGYETRETRASRPAERGRPARPRGVSRLVTIVCGRRSKYLVVAFWILMVAALGSLAGKLQGAEKNDSSAYLPSSAESTQELNEQNLFQSKNLNPALLVYVRDTGITAADLRKADADARYFASLPAVNGRVAAPVVSADHKAIQTVIGADLGYNSDLSGFVSNLKSTATKNDAGLSVYVGGPAASAADELKIFKGIDSTLLYATLAVVVVLLLLTYRSPVLWLLPIMSAGVALTVAEAVIYLLTQHANLVVNGQSGGILVVLVIGASTDYALLLIARYREELRRHEDRHQAMAVALRRAGPAIIASGLTVVAGMICLLAAESNDISGLGPVAAVGIAVGLIAMITLLPALLVIFGRWMFWPARPGLRLRRADHPRGVVPSRAGDRPPPADGVAGDGDPARGQRGWDGRVQVRHADYGRVVSRYPALDHRAAGAGQVFPGRLRRTRRRDLGRRQRGAGQDRAHGHAGHRLRHPAGDQGRPDLPAGDDEAVSGQPRRVHAGRPDTDHVARHPGRRRQGGGRHRDQQGRGERLGP